MEQEYGNDNCGCKNGFTHETFMESFGNDDSMRNCNGCENLIFENGMCTCNKFGGNEK